VLRLGAVLDSRLWVADGGVRGRECEPETLLAESATILLPAAAHVMLTVN
jgi:hypothetical protein